MSATSAARSGGPTVVFPPLDGVDTAPPDVGSDVTPPSTLLDSIFQSIVTPGAGPGLVATINVSLVALLATLAALVYTGDADVHTAVMGGLALGLLGSLNYLISLMRQVEGDAAEEAEKVGGAEVTAATMKEGGTRAISAASGAGSATSVVSAPPRRVAGSADTASAAGGRSRSSDAAREPSCSDAPSTGGGDVGVSATFAAGVYHSASVPAPRSGGARRRHA